MHHRRRGHSSLLHLVANSRRSAATAESRFHSSKRPEHQVHHASYGRVGWPHQREEASPYKRRGEPSPSPRTAYADRKSVVSGKGVSGRVHIGGWRNLKKN